MKKKTRKPALMMAFCVMLLFSTVTVQAKENIRHSTVDYDAMFLEANEIYIGNKKAVDWEVGDKYFLHYTVTNVTEDQTNQSGMLVTKDRTCSFPYEKGGMYFSKDISICEEGWTYLFRFEVTETGLKYVAGKAKGTDSSYIQFPMTTGEIKTKGPYFGVWIANTEGGVLTADFRHMRCYDEKGNDLGVYAPKAAKIDISEMNPLDMGHSYSFSVEKVECLAFGNARYTDSDVIMLEYTVDNVKVKGITQSGAEFTSAPTAYFPHGDDMGYLNYDPHTKTDPTKLLTEDASYLVRFERQDDGFYVLVRRTMINGAVDYFSFANFYGKYRNDYGYIAMWLGQESNISADFTNVKCYDSNGNNLAIQTNMGVDVTHHGDLEDYTQCIADYYCKDNHTIITLDQKSAIRIKGVDEKDAHIGEYSIRNGILKLDVGRGEEKYTYAYEYIKDTEGNKYMRLRESKVTFVSNKVDGEVLATAIVSADTGWKLERPDNPTEGNGEFIAWVDGAGQEYDFDSIVTQAATLYASWDGEQTWEVMENAVFGMDMATIITIVVCVLLVVGTVIASVLVVRKRDRR